MPVIKLEEVISDMKKIRSDLKKIEKKLEKNEGILNRFFRFSIKKAR